MKLLNSPILAIGVAVICVFISHTVQADMPDAKTLKDMEQSGYVLMDRINTPLLYPAGTGKTYDAKLLLLEGRQNLPIDMQVIANDLASSDEFKSHAALIQMRPFLDARINALKQAKGYIIPLRYHLSAYDFDKHRFMLHLGLIIQNPKSADSYQCSGAYDKLHNNRITTCISASNWNERSTAFQYLVIDDDKEAQWIKQQLQNNNVGFFFVMAPEGKLRLIVKKPMKFGSFFNQTIISSVQPAQVLGLILVDFTSGNILISGSIPNAN